VDPKTQARFAARARIIKALAHPTRLFLVDQLAKEEVCVCKLTERVGADMSTVSKHLSILKAAGIVADEKRGNQVFYRLSCPCLLDLFDCVESALKTTAQKQLALVK
jgi:ArsR family transcriptional regulator